MIVWHVCDLKKFEKYLKEGYIKPPVLGFTTIEYARRHSFYTDKKIILRLQFPDGLEPTAYGGNGVYFPEPYPIVDWLKYDKEIDIDRDKLDFMFVLSHITNVFTSFKELGERIIFPIYTRPEDEVEVLKKAMAAFGYAPYVSEGDRQTMIFIEKDNLDYDDIIHMVLFKYLTPNVTLYSIEPVGNSIRVKYVVEGGRK